MGGVWRGVPDGRMLRENIIVIDCSFYPLFVHAIRFSQWSEPDEDALVKFMCEGKNFSEDRIRTGTKRLAKARGGQTQMRMDSFFKVRLWESIYEDTPLHRNASYTLTIR